MSSGNSAILPDKEAGHRSKYDETFDDLLKFGRYTIYLTLVFFMLIISQEMGFDFMAFGGAKPVFDKFECIGDEADSVLANKSDAIARVEDIKDACLIKDELMQIENLSCSMKTHYKYGSIYKKFNLDCDRYFVLLSTAVQNIGMILGVIICGFTTGMFGRKKTLMYALLSEFLFLVASALANSAAVFTLARFFAVISVAGINNVTYIYYVENLPPKWRSILPSCTSSSLAVVLMALMAKLCGDWISLTYACALLNFTTLLLLFKSEETPSFLFGKTSGPNNKDCGDSISIVSTKSENSIKSSTESKHQNPKEKEVEYRKKAKKAAQRIDTFCWSPRTNDFEEKWKKAALQHRKHTIATELVQTMPQKPGACSNTIQLLRDPKLRCFTIIMSITFFTLNMTNYNVILRMDSLPGDIWQNFAIAGAFSYATNWFAVFIEFLCDKYKRPLITGRLPMHLACSGITTILLVIFVVLEFTGKGKSKDPFWEYLVRALSWLIMGVCSQMYIVFHVHCSETFPTPVRATGCSLIQIASRLGTAIGPLILTTEKFIGSYFPYLTMAIMFGLDFIIFATFGYSGCGSENEEERVIRETKGKPKPEVMSVSTTEFLDRLKKVQLSAADLAEFDYKICTKDTFREENGKY